MAAPYRLMFRAIALTLRAGLRGLRPPSAPQRRLRDIFLMSRPPLLREEGSVLPEKLCQKKTRRYSLVTQDEVIAACASCVPFPSSLSTIAGHESSPSHRSFDGRPGRY